MDISSLSIPFTSNEEIHRHADELRSIYWGDKLPINIEVIAERLGIDLFPIPNLRYATGFEACISNDKSIIYYDEKANSNEHRLRFSISHELGHYKLHSAELDLMNPSSYEDWHRIIKEIPKVTFDRFEYQANEFAGRLLVPVQQLCNVFIEIKDKLFEMRKYIGGNFYTTYGFIAKDLSKNFDVSEDVMFKRLKKEGINPYEYI